MGFEGDRDPTTAEDLSNNQRKRLFSELKAACSHYVLNDLRPTLVTLIDRAVDGCLAVPDEDDVEGQTLLIEYPTLYASEDVPYVMPRVRIEAGARSGLEPNQTSLVVPYIDNELPDRSFEVANIRVLAPERTLWEKFLILHGTHCGYRYEQRVPADSNRISRHYYDIAMIMDTEIGKSALSDFEVLDAVREHNLIAFPQAWKRFEEAVPGTLRLVPQPELQEAIKKDYTAMQGMILGDAPEFVWILEQLERAEAAIN